MFSFHECSTLSFADYRVMTGITGFAGFASIIDCITNCNARSRSRIDKVKTALGRSCITGIREWEQDRLLVEEESGHMMYYHILFEKFMMDD